MGILGIYLVYWVAVGCIGYLMSVLGAMGTTVCIGHLLGVYWVQWVSTVFIGHILGVYWVHWVFTGCVGQVLLLSIKRIQRITSAY